MQKMWRKRRRREKRAYKNEDQDQPIVKLVSRGRKKKNSSHQNDNRVLTSCIKKPLSVLTAFGLCYENVRKDSGEYISNL